MREYHSFAGFFLFLCDCFWGERTNFSDKKLYKKFVGIGKSCIFASLFERRVFLKEVWRGGRVVDYSGLENRRTATFRGFESLPLR